jgi:hypothetical protein
MTKILATFLILSITSCAYYEPGSANNSVNTYVQPTYTGYGYGGYYPYYGGYYPYSYYGGYYPYYGGYYGCGWGGWGGYYRY